MGQQLVNASVKVETSLVETETEIETNTNTRETKTETETFSVREQIGLLRLKRVGLRPETENPKLEN